MASKEFKSVADKIKGAADTFINTSKEEEDIQNTPDTASEPNTLKEPNTVNVPNTQNKNVKTRKQKHPRINMVFHTENHEYLEYITRLKGVSITQYVNDLIAKDAEENKETIEKFKALMNG